jgi:hypothetical protein
MPEHGVPCVYTTNVKDVARFSEVRGGRPVRDLTRLDG